MSILTDVLPDTVVICGKHYAVRTDFRVWIEFDKVIRSRKISAGEKTGILMKLCFDRKRCRFLPSSPGEAIAALSGFYMCGKQGNVSEKGDAKTCEVFSFEEDADYVYSAFLTQYGIDLTDVLYLHWYKFSAMFKGLDDNLRLMKIISARAADLSGISGEKGKYLKKMKELYALPDTRNEEEKARDTAEILSALF